MIFANPVPNVGEGRIWLLGHDYNSEPQGTWVIENNAAGIMGNLYNSTHTNLDEVVYKAYFSRGHYVGRFMYNVDTNKGKMDIYVGSTKVLSAYDCYGVAPIFAAGYSISPGFSISVPGIYEVRVVVNGKNAASTDYYLSLYYISFWRTT